MENKPTPKQLKDAAIEKALDALVEVLNERPKPDNWMERANQRKADLSSALRNYYGASMPPALHKASWLAIERKVMRRLPLGEAANVLPEWSKIRNEMTMELARQLYAANARSSDSALLAETANMPNLIILNANDLISSVHLPGRPARFKKEWDQEEE
jgi:hypothetical protein